MNLFDITSPKFYSLLTGKNKNIYVISLMILYTMINDNEMIVKKDDYIRFLKEQANSFLSNFLVTEDEDYNEEILDNSNLSSYIVRRLEECGWIVLEMDPETLAEYIILPSYSIKQITTIYEIINESSETYSSFVHSTYSELHLEDQVRDEFMYATLLRAYENTKKLKVDLITLSHSIKIYQSKLNRLYTSNDVLHSYFDNYKELVSDRLYHPLKTFDSVTKFKRPILNILNKWLTDVETRKLLIKQALIYSSSKLSIRELENDIITKINYICDIYDSMNTLIDNIDDSHRNYTKSSTNKILYLNNTDRSVKGNLENIFIGLAKNWNNISIAREIVKDMQDSITLFNHGFIDSDSISLPIYRKFATNESPLELYGFDTADDAVMENFLSQINGLYTDEKIYEFMEEILRGKDELESKDIPIKNYDAFILLILGTLKKDDPDCFYYVLYESKDRINNNGYLIPKMKFIRKKEGD